MPMRIVLLLAIASLALVGCQADDDPTPRPAASTAAGTDADYTIVGTEFAFQEVPESIPAGSTIGFVNSGQEDHEMIVLYKNDDSDISFEDHFLFEQGDTELETATVGRLVAGPGEVANATVTLDEPGEYALLCFFPVAADGDPRESDNPDTQSYHHQEGMFATFVVTADADDGN